MSSQPHLRDLVVSLESRASLSSREFAWFLIEDNDRQESGNHGRQFHWRFPPVFVTDLEIGPIITGPIVFAWSVFDETLYFQEMCC